MAASSKNYGDFIQGISEELIATWDAAEDLGESDLLDALGEASEKGESALARRIFEGAIAYVAEELLCGSSKEEINRLISQYERNYPSENYRRFLVDK